DFGIAQADGDSGTTTAGTTVGTAAYMAPEQAQAAHITAATDLYSVGVMLYEMLTGSLPFDAPSTMALMLEHIRTLPPSPSHRMPRIGIPWAMDAVVLQVMAKRPDERFPSPLAMKHAVMRAFPGGDARSARPTAARSASRGASPARDTPRRMPAMAGGD